MRFYIYLISWKWKIQTVFRDCILSTEVQFPAELSEVTETLEYVALQQIFLKE